eukprot:CAMPEP_0177478006 /NCGR_PEP_ID=MMETSP0369-20130122/24445_1 /TAXON_ID=447022 ORGANISM="Scrippsiella hangoei-like, Strain SHHI-4" /NCGR_SAMPLE_ID=MMETSP0369 /ASSEMBLY_ACC=CAM_ASM_000364 /LENGTH=112 /DNA_ID=CAMNT_0018953385 /DNA_START=332 /DNA_END=667 /DNA_ORIENTATION=+
MKCMSYARFQSSKGICLSPVPTLGVTNAALPATAQLTTLWAPRCRHYREGARAAAAALMWRDATWREATWRDAAWRGASGIAIAADVAAPPLPRGHGGGTASKEAWSNNSLE